VSGDELGVDKDIVDDTQDEDIVSNLIVSPPAVEVTQENDVRRSFIVSLCCMICRLVK
jgi:hypothetical protein